eukprot:6695787-Prymnesium_polylepis.1
MALGRDDDGMLCGARDCGAPSNARAPVDEGGGAGLHYLVRRRTPSEVLSAGLILDDQEIGSDQIRVWACPYYIVKLYTYPPGPRS